MGKGGGGAAVSLQPTEEELAIKAEAEKAKLREMGITPIGESVTNRLPAYRPPTQTSDYANPIPQYTPSNFNMTPYAQAYQQQFGQNMQQIGQSLPPVQNIQAPSTVSGLGALAQLYGMYNAAPQTAEAQSTHAASLTAAANTPI